MTKLIALCTAVVFGTGAVAHELDSEKTIPAEQIRLAKDLPQTLVVRVKKTDRSQVEVVHLKEALKPGRKPAHLKFEKMALGAEKTGIAFNSGNELDLTSSTSSWGFWLPFALGIATSLFTYGIANSAYGYGYGYPAAYYPAYNYGGYTYSYSPYYSYSESEYDYTYYGWGY